MSNITELIRKRMVLIVAALFAAGAFAGCVDEPEQAEEPIAGDDVGVGDEDVGQDEGLGAEDEGVFGEGVGDEDQNVNNVVMINGEIYECDTFFEISNIPGVCDEYQRVDGVDADAAAGVAEFTADQEGIVTIDGTQYRCDDEFGLGGGEGLGEEDAAAQDDALAQQEACEEYVVVGSDE